VNANDEFVNTCKLQNRARAVNEPMQSVAQAGNPRTTLTVEQSRNDKFEMIGRISAGLAHELNDPIGIALGFTELAKQSLSPPMVPAPALTVSHPRSRLSI
jgi:signal transduction histidine kinase